MPPLLKIVYTTWTVANRTGAELFVSELAVAVSRRGHSVCVLTPFKGPLAETLAQQGIPVVADARLVPFAPDVIHAQHQPALAAALRAFPRAPAIFTIHDATSKFDEPVELAQIARYVAVDGRCRARIERNPAIDRKKIETVLNAVDLARFKARPHLPEAPRRALVFSNYASARTHLAPILEACRRCALEVDVIGSAAATAVAAPECVLPKYDLVFAKARCALEAMASGAATILCDYAGLGSIVTSANVAQFRALNFGGGLLTREATAGAIEAEIRKYDPYDAQMVSKFVREDADFENAVAQWIDLYRRVAAGGPMHDTADDAAMLTRLNKRWAPAYTAKRVFNLLDRTPLLGAAISRAARPIWRRAMSAGA